jgi:hypothetical protein
MDTGELFFIENPKLDLEGKVLWAAKSYQQKYGRKPTLCMLHPSLLRGGTRRVGGLHLEAKKSILPNYLWIGIANDATTPLAR